MNISAKNDGVNNAELSGYVFLKATFVLLLSVFLGCISFQQTYGQSKKLEIPDWALPGSATHKQVPPPPDFHNASRTTLKPIGIFKGQTDVGGAVLPGSSTYNKATKQYSITSAVENAHQMDENLWEKLISSD